MDGANVNYLFQLVSSTIVIKNQTKISLQDDIVDAFVATVKFDGVTIYNSKLNGVSIQITGSTLNFENVDMYNITTSTPQHSIVKTSMESNTYWNNVSYRDSEAQIFTFQSSY